MATLFENDDSSDEDFSDNLQLAERLRLNRENKLAHFQKKNFKDGQSSSSSSLEMHNDLLQPGTSRNHISHNKKRQNGDKNIELLANPKRTCLSNRFPKSDFQNKKKTYLTSDQMPNFSYSLPTSENGDLYPDKTYEDHLNLSDGQKQALNSCKQYSKKAIFSNVSDNSKSAESAHNTAQNFSAHQDPKSLQNAFRKCSNTNKASSEQLMWRVTDYGMKDHPKTLKTKIAKSVFPTGAHIPDLHKDAIPNDSNIVYVDSASDEESKPLLKSGALKGGKQGPVASQNNKKVVGPKINKKVLVSDEDSEEAEDNDWLFGRRRRRPCLIFSSSESDTEELSDSRKASQASLSSKSAVNNKVSAADRAISAADRAISAKELLYPVPKDPQINYRFLDIGGGHTAAVYVSKSPARSYRNRKQTRSVPSDAASTSFHYSRNHTAAVKGRSRVNVGERHPRRSGSPHPKTSLNSHSRIQNIPEVQKSDKGQSLQARRANMNLATTFPDVCDVDEDSSEVEFFTANSYSDAENSVESFGGLRISTTLRNQDRNGVICEHSINVGSSEDEISVVFSSNPLNEESTVDSHVIRNIEPRRGARTLGRRRERGSWRQRQNNVPEVVSLSPDPVEQVRQVEEDERYAKQLQAQFDAEVDEYFIPPSSPRSSPVLTVSPISNEMSSISDDDERDPNLEMMHYSFCPLVDHYPLNPHETRNLQRSIDRLNYSSHSSLFDSLFLNRIGRNGGRPENYPRAFQNRLIESRSAWNSLFSLNDSESNYETFLGLADLNGDVPHGLQKGEINRLPTRKFVIVGAEGCSSGLPHKRAGLNKECQVCLTDYENGDTLRILPCFHEFHTPCIDPWLKINNTCPVCRVVVNLEG